jgi:hypothetical protein
MINTDTSLLVCAGCETPKPASTDTNKRSRSPSPTPSPSEDDEAENIQPLVVPLSQRTTLGNLNPRITNLDQARLEAALERLVADVEQNK